MADELASTLVARSLEGHTSPHVVVTPLVTQDESWYFIVTTYGPEGMRSDGYYLEERDETARQACLAQLARHPQLVIHDCSSELEAIRLCSELWPDGQVEDLRQRVEAELNGRPN